MTHLRKKISNASVEMFDGKQRSLLVKDASNVGSVVMEGSLSYALGFLYAQPGYLLFSRARANEGVWAVPFSAGPLDLNKAVLLQSAAGVLDAGGTMAQFLPKSTRLLQPMNPS